MKPILPIAALSLLAATGCGGSLAYVHNTVLGVDVTAAAEGTARIAVGYDSETFAVVPRFDPVGDGRHGDAMTLVSVSNVDVNGLEEIIFNHVIATGEAARLAAEDTQGLSMMRKAVFGVEPAAATAAE